MPDDKDTEVDDDWMPCMTLMLQGFEEDSKAEEELRAYLREWHQPGPMVYTITAVPGEVSARIRHSADASGGNGPVCAFWPQPISPELVADFRKWRSEFDEAIGREADARALRARLEARGAALAMRIKTEIGNEATVMYHAPLSDAHRDNDGDPKCN